jgi:hypothetical protein
MCQFRDSLSLSSSGNILVTDGGRLVPIDHGCALPSNLEDVFFEWMTWPQAKQPIQTELRDAVLQLNIAEQERVLRSIGLPETAIALSSLATKWLKEGVRAGATLYEIAQGICRDGDLSKPSPLEQLLDRTQPARVDAEIIEHFKQLQRC